MTRGRSQFLTYTRSLDKVSLIAIRKLVTGFREVEDALIKTVKGREQLEAQKRQADKLNLPREQKP